MPERLHSESVQGRLQTDAQTSYLQTPSAEGDSQRNPVWVWYSMSSKYPDGFFGKSLQNTFRHPEEYTPFPVSADGHPSKNCFYFFPVWELSLFLLFCAE